jgi:DNA-binding NarL/FixJ family response regulator
MSAQTIETPTAVLALPDPLLATALSIAMAPYCRVVASVATWADLEDQLDTLQLAVVVLDVVVGHDEVLPHLHQLVATYPASRFVVCSMHPDAALTHRALIAGATAVVGHDVAVTELVDALCTLCRDGTWPDGVGTAAARMSMGRVPLKRLSPRLHHVNELLWQGKRQVEIVRELELGLSTVQRHITEIRKAYGVPSGLPGPWEQARELKRGRVRGF